MNELLLHTMSIFSRYRWLHDISWLFASQLHRSGRMRWSNSAAASLTHRRGAEWLSGAARVATWHTATWGHRTPEQVGNTC